MLPLLVPFPIMSLDYPMPGDGGNATHFRDHRTGIENSSDLFNEFLIRKVSEEVLTVGSES